MHLRYKTFVGNRISLILQEVPPSHWFHVPTLHNPADCASRGLMPGELLEHTLWWEGPTWLAVEPITFPQQPSLASVVLPEQRLIACHLHVHAPPELVEVLYGNYYKTLTLSPLTFWSKFLHFSLKMNIKSGFYKVHSNHTFSESKSTDQFCG